MYEVKVKESQEIISLWSSANNKSLPDIIKSNSEIYKWCKDNIKHTWCIDELSSRYLVTYDRYHIYYFENENDAVLAKLVWGI